MSAVPAYDFNYAEREVQHDWNPKPRISVVPGGSPRTSSQSSPDTSLLIKVVVALFIAFAVVCFVRVAFSTQAMVVALDAQKISTQIEAARDEGSALEVSVSSLSSPSHLKASASDLGMAAPTEIQKLDLSGDVVVTDEQGALSLSKSMAAAESVALAS